MMKNVKYLSIFLFKRLLDLINDDVFYSNVQAPFTDKLYVMYFFLSIFSLVTVN